MRDYRDALRQYLEEERKVSENLPLEDINRVMQVLEQARLSGKRIFICGNGGSASTASHFAGDFNKGVSYDHGQKQRYDFECLNDNLPTLLATANDTSYDDVFVLPLSGKLHEGDVVIGISGSGNSENVVRALDYANQHGGITVAFTGYDGGKLKQIAQHNVHVAVDNMQIVEDMHLALDHMMMWVLSEELKR